MGISIAVGKLIRRFPKMVGKFEYLKSFVVIGVFVTNYPAIGVSAIRIYGKPYDAILLGMKIYLPPI